MLEMDYKNKVDEITNWLTKTIHEAGFEKVVVAVSGGVDSSVSIALAVRVLGKDNVYALMLPYGKLNKKGVKDAILVLDSVELPKQNRFTVDITSGVEGLWGVISNGRTEQSEGDCLPDRPGSERSPRGDFSPDAQVRNDNIRLGNIMARVRMIYLFDFAKKYNCLVVGTENKTENYLGYFTRFGDEASDVEPIRGLYKTQVWEMAKCLGLPKEVIEKAPSAGLWESQTDEGEFGFGYRDADRVLYHYFEEKLPREGIVALGIDEKIVDDVLKWVEKNAFKHHLPYVIDD